MSYYQQPPAGYQQQAPAGYAQQQAPAGYAQQQQAAPVSYHPPPQQGNPELQRWFESVDTDRSGEIDAQELQRALGLGNLHYGVTDVDQMVRAFDQRGKRTLNCQEFGALHNFLTSVTQSFQYFDQDRGGSLDTNEVMSALRHAGFHLDQPVLQAMFHRHDPNKTGKLELDEYIRMCLFLQSCVRTFTAFDTQRSGRINLDFNQFVYAASHIC